jgi:hypothetical protein
MGERVFSGRLPASRLLFFVEWFGFLEPWVPGLPTGQALMGFWGRQNAGEPTVTVASFFCGCYYYYCCGCCCCCGYIKKGTPCVGGWCFIFGLASSSVCWDRVVWASEVSRCAQGVVRS